MKCCKFVAKFQKIQLANLVDFEKCCKTRIFLQRSVPIQPKTSNILPKFCQTLATTLRVRRADDDGRCSSGLAAAACRLPDYDCRLAAPDPVGGRCQHPAERTECWTSIFQNFANFEGLVLGCIDADFRNQIFVGKHLARPIRFASLCTSNRKISAALR